MITLRDFQAAGVQQIQQAWQLGARCVLYVLATGGGKTVVFSHKMAQLQAPSIAIAHRQEIVSQISLALARNGVHHRVIGPKNVIRNCVNLHLQEVGKNYIDANSPRAVAGVDTLIRMEPTSWFDQVRLVVLDEGHHVLKDNKWGAAAKMFPNANILLVTATPERADGKGLSRASDGFVDEMIQGPSMRELITRGYLCDYRIFAPPSDLDLSAVPLGSSGDYSPPKLSVAVHKSHIVGDVVSHYMRIASGKLGVTFAVDVKAAEEIVKAYKDAGVPAEMVTAKTPDNLRASIMRRLRNRDILNVVNVDLFGEGFDLPAIEVVSMARPTQSYALYAQQFGRALRPMEGKEHAIIIDHVGNVHRHGLPDAPRQWRLGRRDRRARQQASIAMRTCPFCFGAYEARNIQCPYCGHQWVPANRSTPEAVDGDLYELDPAVLAQLRGQVDAPPKFPHGATPEIVGSLKKHHRERTEAQALLRAQMAQWAGQRSQSQDEQVIRQLQREFYLTFGIDVLSAQLLPRKDAEQLRERIEKHETHTHTL